MSTAEHPDALSRRIEQLAAASVEEPEGAVLVALLGALRAEIGAVRSELTSVRAETGGLRTDVDGLGSRLSGSVAAGRSETGALLRRVAELATRVDGLGGRLEDVRTALPALSRELRESVEQLPTRTATRLDALSAELTERLGGRVDAVASEMRRSLAAAGERETRLSGEQGAALDDARGVLESRLAVLEEALDGLSERIEALARDGASTTTGLLQSLGEGVRELDLRLGEQGRTSAERVVEQLGALGDARAGALEGSLVDRLSGLLAARDEALRAELRAALDAVGEQAASDRAATQQLATTVQEALVGFGALLERSLGGVERSLAAAVADGSARAHERLVEVDDRLSSAVTVLRAELLSRDEAAAGQLTGVQEAVEARLEQVRAQVNGALAGLRSDVGAEVGALAPRIDELARSGAATGEAVHGLRTDLLETVGDLRERLLTASSDSTDAVLGVAAQVRTAVDEATRALREELLGAVEQQSSVVVERLAAVAAEVARTTAATRNAGDRLSALAALTDVTGRTLDDVRAAVLAATGELATDLRAHADEQTAATAGRLVELDAQVRAHVAALSGDVGERLAELRSSFVDGLGELAAGMDGAVTTTRAASERVTALAEVGDRQRAEVERLLRVVHEDVVTASRQLREDLLARTTEQLAALGQRLAALDTTVAEDASATQQVAGGLTDLAGTLGRLEETVGGFRDEWPTRTYEVVEGAKAVAQGVVLDVREEVAARLEQVRATLAEAVGGVEQARTGLDGGTDRLARAGLVLVAYLEQRDRLLEAERDRVLHDVLDAFASGLSARERTALAGRVHDVVARRRDARDAERYRSAVGQPVPPTVGLPDDVLDLVPLDADQARAQDAGEGPPQGGATPTGAAGGGPAGGGAAGGGPAGGVVGAPGRSTRPTRPATRTAAAAGRPATVRAAAGGTAVLPGPGKRVAAAGEKGAVSAASTAAGAAPAPAEGGQVTASPPDAGNPAPATSADAPSPAGGTATRAASPGSSSGPVRSAARSGDRRGRLDVMPQVPSVAIALDAAAPQGADLPGGPPAADAGSPGRAGEDVPSSADSAAAPATGGEDVPSPADPAVVQAAGGEDVPSSAHPAAAPATGGEDVPSPADPAAAPAAGGEDAQSRSSAG